VLFRSRGTERRRGVRLPGPPVALRFAGGGGEGLRLPLKCGSREDAKRAAQSSPARGGGPPKVVEGQVSLFRSAHSSLPDSGLRRGGYRGRGWVPNAH